MTGGISINMKAASWRLGSLRNVVLSISIALAYVTTILVHSNGLTRYFAQLEQPEHQAAMKPISSVLCASNSSNSASNGDFLPESGFSLVHSAKNGARVMELHQCDIPVVVGTDMAATRGLLANIYSTILNYKDEDSRNLCIFVYAKEQDYIARHSSLVCAFGDVPLPPNVQVITKLISKSNWNPYINSAVLMKNGDALNSDYNWFRYYLKQQEIGGTSKRCIWLDTDILIQGNVAELYDFDLKGRVVAAGVYDEPLLGFLITNNKHSREELNKIPMTDENISPLRIKGHLNCGLLVIDLEQMERQGILLEWSRLKQIHDQTPLYTLDQAAFTLAIHGKFEPLPPEWNHGDLGWLGSKYAKKKAAKYIQKCQTAKALHWNGRQKPWNDDVDPEIVGCLEMWKVYDIVTLQHKQHCLRTSFAC